MKQGRVPGHKQHPALDGQQHPFPGLGTGPVRSSPVTTQPPQPSPSGGAQGLGRTQLKAQLRGRRRVLLVSLHTVGSPRLANWKAQEGVARERGTSPLLWLRVGS